MDGHTIEIDGETADKVMKLTKRELAEKFCLAALEAETYKLRCQTAIEDTRRVTKEADQLRTKLDKAESYVEQGRAMVNAVMERWYEYDT